MEALTSSIPRAEIKGILDLGCGTGHFTFALGKAFECPVIGVDPSAAMLDIAKSQNDSTIVWNQGAAENIPLKSQSVDLVFISQVFHHLVQPLKALQEITRVLTSGGYLVIRNGTKEHNHEIEWLQFFPEALEIEERRMLLRTELSKLVASQTFVEILQRTIDQMSATSYQAHFENVRHRGLSSLIAINDEAFSRGLKHFQKWVNLQPRDVPVYEALELFVFRKLLA